MTGSLGAHRAAHCTSSRRIPPLLVSCDLISLPELTPQFTDVLGEAFEMMKGLMPAGGAHG
jgi:hypothetical protein